MRVVQMRRRLIAIFRRDGKSRDIAGVVDASAVLGVGEGAIGALEPFRAGTEDDSGVGNGEVLEKDVGDE